MIKNIPALSLLWCVVWLTFIRSSEKTVSVPDLSDANIAYLRTVLAQQKNASLCIQVHPKQTYSQALQNFLNTPYQAFKNRFTFASVAKITCSALINMGWIGYLLCAYSIYRVYRIINSISSWVNWCTDKELLLSHDELLYEKLYRYKRSFKRSLSLLEMKNEIAQEEKLLLNYFTLDAFLRKYRLRNCFPYSDADFNSQVKTSYLKLLKIQTLMEQNHTD